MSRNERTIIEDQSSPTSDFRSYPAGREPVSPGPRRSNPGLVLLIVAAVTTLCGWVLALPAVILAALSMGNQSSPSRSQRLVRWGWIAYAIAITVLLVAAAFLFAIATYAAGGKN